MGYIMRTALIFILLFIIALPCLAELTQQDLEKIGNLIDRKLEPVKLDIAEMKGKIEALEGKMATKDDLLNMRKDFSEELKSVKSDIVEMKGKMATKDELKFVQQDVTEMKSKMVTKDELSDMWRDVIGKIYVLYGIIIAVFIAIIGVMLTIIFAPRWTEQRNGKRLQRIEAEIESIRETEEKRRETARKIAEEKPEFEEAYRMIGLL